MTSERSSTDGGSSPAGSADRFLLDVMLGKLATYLRMCGYDAAYALDRGVEADDRLRELAAAEGRTLLTRDVNLAARTEGAVLVESLDVEGQLRELHDRGLELTLRPDDQPVRCGRCNAEVLRVEGSDPRPAYVPDDGAVWRCRRCGQYFWPGSHWDDVRSRLRELWK